MFLLYVVSWGMGDFQKRGDPSNRGMILKWGSVEGELIPLYGIWELFRLIEAHNFYFTLKND